MQMKVYDLTKNMRQAASHQRKTLLLNILFLTLSFLLTTSLASAQSWTQRGADLDGVSGEGFGASVSLSSDGNTMAIGTNDDDVAANNPRSSVKVKTWNGTAWVQKGSTLYGEQDGNNFGFSVSLSADGNILAVGAHTHSDVALYGEFSFSGRAYVYDWSGTDWVLRSTALIGDAAQENFGTSVSLSEDGNVLAVGAPGANAGGTLRGVARVYTWNGSTWAKLGSDIQGSTDFENLGTSVSVKVTGTESVLAIGAPTFTPAPGSDFTGRVKIYRDSEGSWGGTWSSPEILDGSNTGDYFGYSVSLSNDGSRLAIGAPTDGLFSASFIGYARVFDYAASSFTQSGADIVSDIVYDTYAERLALSGDGNYLIIGAKGGIGNENGRAEVYTFNASAWQQVGSDLLGEAENDYFGQAVAISETGTVIAIGGSVNQGGGPSSGHVRTFTQACAPPAAPTGAATQLFCSGATLPQVVATGTAIQWYDAASGGALLPTTTVLTNGTIYYASQTISACESTNRLAVTITLNTTATPTGDAAQTFCAGATIANLSATGTDIKWYDASTAGTLLISTATLVNGTTYYASQTISGCESARLAVTATVNTTPAPTVNGTVQFFCNEGTVADLVVTGTDIKWYSEAQGGIQLSSSTALVNGDYYASQTINGCESATRVKLTASIIVLTAPIGNAAQAFCEGATVGDLAASGESGLVIKWYTEATGGTLLESSTTLVNGTTYFAGQSVDALSCSSENRLAVTVELLPLPATPLSDVTQPTCSVATGTITITTQNAGDTYSFNNGTDYQSSNVMSGLAAGDYQVLIKNTNGCASAPATVTIAPQPITPSQAVVTLTQPSCTVSTGTITVTAQQAGETYSFNNGTDYESSNIKSGLTPGEYQVIIKSAAGCLSVATLATVNAAPAIPDAPTGNTTQSFCNNATVAQLTATGTSIKWYAAETGGTPLATTTALQSGTYYASQTVACESTARLAVAVTITILTAPTGDAVQNFCEESTVAELTATAPEAISWYTTPTGGTPLAGTVVLTTGTYYAGYTQNGCESPRLAVAVDYAFFWNTMAAGASHALAIHRDGTLWAWGNNSRGQLGIGNTTNQQKPVKVGTDRWTAVATGDEFSAGLKQDGTLWTWGRNDLGQLGNGTQTGSSVPTQVGTNKWLSVAATYDHVLALREDGTLWTWGGNTWAQLTSAGGSSGVGTFKSLPLQIGTDNNWVFISAGWGTSAGIKQDGTLWTWGGNEFGQLGRGNILGAGEGDPLVGQVGTDKWKTIHMGVNASIGIKENNTLWISGFNNTGMLGNGTTTSSSIHVQVGTDLWLSASVSGLATAGIKQDGTLWTWGNNSVRQLGNGTTVSTTTPGQVGTSNQWRLVSSWGHNGVSGSEVVLGLQQDGTLWSWGSSNSGELGTNTTTNATPTRLGGAPPVIAQPVINLDLANAAQPVLTTSGGSEYLWFKNGSLIEGANAATYTVAAEGGEGVYTVAVVGARGCSSPLSDEVPIYITALDFEPEATIQLYPNPAQESLLVKVDAQAQLSVVSMSGHVQHISTEWLGKEQAHRVNVQGLISGMYILQIQQNGKRAQVKFIRQ